MDPVGKILSNYKIPIRKMVGSGVFIAVVKSEHTPNTYDVRVYDKKQNEEVSMLWPDIPKEQVPAAIKKAKKVYGNISVKRYSSHYY